MKKIFLLCFLLASFFVSAQTENFVTEKIQLNYLGLSQPAINFNGLPSSGLITRFEKDEDEDKEGRRKNLMVNTAAFFKGADPVMQATTNALNIAINQRILVEGPDISVSGVSPPDVNGESGGSYYLQTINVSSGSLVSIYNKSNGVLASTFNTNTAFWSPLGFSSVGDPVILYDEVAQKWILVEMRSTGNQILFAVSQTNNPAGAWHRYNFSTSAFPDFPKLSIWNNAILMTDNENGLAAAPIYAINKSAVYAGTSSTILRTTIPFVSGVGFQPITPIDWDGTTVPTGDPMVIRMYDNVWSNSGDADHVELRTIAINFTTNTITPSAAINVNTAAFNSFFCNSFNCMPQFDSNTLLDNQAEYINYRSQYRNFGTHSSIVCAFGVNVDGTINGRSGIRWMELRKVGAGVWSVYQEGTYAPDDGLSRFVGSIAIDAFNNIALGYNVVNNTNKYYSARVTGRLASDALGSMTFAENEMATGTHPYTGGGGRTGDYYSISVDPSDGKTFWFTSHYAKTVSSNASWGTKIIAFKLEPDCIIPIQPGVFTAATATVCKGQSSVVYTVPAVSGATSYTWTYSGTGATFSSTTRSVSINYLTTATSGTLSVKANKVCGSGPARSMAVTVNSVPIQPGVFTAATATVCKGQSSVVYAVPAVTGATSYTWTYSGTGATFSSTTRSVSINYSTTATSGILSVKANNACGSGLTRTMAVTVNSVPIQPGVFTAATATVCKGQSLVVYAVPAVTGATSYTWTYSGTGATFSSTTRSVSINYSTTATSGTLSVKANNACGSGLARSMAVTVNNIPTTPVISTNKPTICSGLGAVLTATGCTGIVIWSNGATGSSITVTPVVNTVYNAVCSNTPCSTSSVSSNISITVISQNLAINSTTPAPYQAKENITTSGTIAISGNKKYKAGKSIVLSSSPSNTISTNIGAVFEAKIEGCSY